MKHAILKSYITGGRGYSVFVDDPNRKKEIMITYGDNILAEDEIEDLKKDRGFLILLESKKFKILNEKEIQKKEAAESEKARSAKNEEDAKMKFASELKAEKQKLNAEIDRQKSILRDTQNQASQEKTVLNKKIAELETENSKLLGEVQKLKKQLKTAKNGN